jgi:hypothetical protein
MNRRGWNYYSSGADDEITMVGLGWQIIHRVLNGEVRRGRIITLIIGESPVLGESPC